MRIRKKIGKGREITKEDKSDRIDFARKKNPPKGIISFVLALVSLAGLVAVSIISAVYGGNAGIAVGIAGLLLFVLDIVGIILPIKCFKMRNVSLKFCLMGMIGNGVLAVLYIVLYVFGLAA